MLIGVAEGNGDPGMKGVPRILRRGLGLQHVTQLGLGLGLGLGRGLGLQHVTLNRNPIPHSEGC